MLQLTGQGWVRFEPDTSAEAARLATRAGLLKTPPAPFGAIQAAPAGPADDSDETDSVFELREPDCVRSFIETGVIPPESAAEAAIFAGSLVGTVDALGFLLPYEALWVYVAAKRMGLAIGEVDETIIQDIVADAASVQVVSDWLQ